ncbi:MAG TPA: COX15/CtaA family protein [Solirubrobacterales bacterium]|nr:COX15/CtaA family protein [Solirubrobacterales bacterium]
MHAPRAGGGGEQLRRFRRLAHLTALITFLLVVVGGVVRVSDSGLGCGPKGAGTEGWPLCGGAVIPLVGDENRLIEFSHRVLAGVVVVLIALLCWRAYRELRARRWAVRGSIAAVTLVLVQAGLGGLTVEHGLEDELVAAHLGLAMLLLGLLLWLSARARAEIAEGAPSAPAPEPGPAGPVPGLRPYAAVAAILLLSAIVAGGYMAGTEKEGVHEDGRNVAGAHLACGEQFPECGEGRFLPFGENRLTDIHLTHRALVYAATIAILALLAVALVRGSRDRWLGVAALLLAVQLLLGALNVWLGEDAVLIVAHLTTATLLWIAVLEIGYRLAWLPSAAPAERPPRRAETSVAAA